MTMNESYWHGRKFGSLQMKTPGKYGLRSHKKVTWLCDCGKEKDIRIYSVTTGNTKSCRLCNQISKEEMASRKFGKLRLKEPKAILPGSRGKLIWICECGNETKLPPLRVTRVHTTSCGRCNIIPASYFENTKYGKLRLKEPKESYPSSHEVVTWLCDCGKEAELSFYVVTSGHSSSCGKCNIKPASYWADREFGFLRMKDPVDISHGSNIELTWLCRCGGETVQQMYTVYSGKVVRCNDCSKRAQDWYQSNLEAIKSISTPIKRENFPSGWMIPLDETIYHDKPFRALCGSCGEIYVPRWHNIKRGSSITCGCSSNRISRGQAELASFIESLGLDPFLEYSIDNLIYDIFVPSGNLLIEYNGLRWHRGTSSKRRDLNKYELAIQKGFNFISIFEDEWLDNPNKVKSLFQNKLLKSSAKSLRPSQCDIKLISSKQSNPFYEKYHYIGRCNAKFHYGVFYGNELISCISFSRPTRQTSKYEYELIRMVSHPDYRVHGIWSKILKQFIQNHNPTSIVSFSDNRLFQGGVYSKIGFSHDGNIAPDYYWVKGAKRYHKSGLRKKASEKKSGMTEIQLRQAQGYFRVWDLGKKRWVLTPSIVSM